MSRARLAVPIVLAMLQLACREKAAAPPPPITAEVPLQELVPADVNLAAIAAALGRARNGAVDTAKLAGLNHLFQPATTGLLDEYATIETTFDEQALDRITEWLTTRTRTK